VFIFFLGVGAMFGASMLWVFTLWSIESKAISREIKRKYPKWKQ